MSGAPTRRAWVLRRPDPRVSAHRLGEGREVGATTDRVRRRGDGRHEGLVSGVGPHPADL